MVIDDNAWSACDFLRKIQVFNPNLDVSRWSVLASKPLQNGRILITYMMDPESYAEVKKDPYEDHLLLGTNGNVRTWKYGEKRKESICGNEGPENWI